MDPPGRWTPMISAIVGRFIFFIQSCHPCATSCAAAASAASAASATVLAPARFAFSPGTLRTGRSLSGDSEICRDGFEIECFPNKVSQRDDKVVCRHMATLHQLLRRESRHMHAADSRERRREIRPCRAGCYAVSRQTEKNDRAPPRRAISDGAARDACNSSGVNFS